MSIDNQKIEQISLKIDELIAQKDQCNQEVERLKRENDSLRNEVLEMENQHQKLSQEVGKLKTMERMDEAEPKNLDEAKINGMIKEIEECLALLKS